MANFKTMKAAAEAVTKGQTRESQAKRFKVSVSTIDLWRQKVALAAATTGNGTELTKGSKVPKNQTRLAQLEAENRELTQIVGRMFVAISRAGNGKTSHA